MRLLQQDPYVGPTLRCVCSVDESWMEPVTLPASYVINTDTKEGPGDHWVAFYISKGNHCDYFDSAGAMPIPPIARWLDERVKTVRYNDQWLQSPTSSVCGQYCIYFLRERARNRTIDDILTDFREYQFKYNDRRVARAVSRILSR